MFAKTVCWLLLTVSFSGTAGALVPDSSEVYVVRFAGPALGRQSAEVEAMRSRRPDGRRRLDAGAPASRVFLDGLDLRQANRLAEIERAVGRGVEVVFRYRAVLNGVALRLDAAEAAAVGRLPGIVSVRQDTSRPADTDVTGAWIGADGVWDGSGVAPLPASRGEGVVVGIIDSGINFGHESFSDTPADGYFYSNPLGSGNFLGWCDPAHPSHSPSYACNDKLIGAWDFVDATSVEDDGPADDDYFHGPHMAGIAAGNGLESPSMSGLAPRAQVVAYDVCVNIDFVNHPCSLSASLAALDQAVFDGVDVVNYSIQGTADPWGLGDFDLAALDAVAAGVSVVASASNDGPAAGTVRHLGPWVTTVGYSTHDRVEHTNGLVDLTGGASSLGDLAGVSLTAQGHGPAPIVYQGDCSAPFAPGTWTQDEIVVCDRILFFQHVIYCQNVEAGGAGGCVVIDPPGGPTRLVTDHYTLPATQLDTAAGTALTGWLASGSGHQGTLTAAAGTSDPAAADVIDDLSGRGPNPSFDVLKPDLVAPGKAILSAAHAGQYPGYLGDNFLIASGTSMASAVVTGATALLTALHPDWTPSEVKSALMTTAERSLKNEDLSAADPFDRGAGRIAPARAALAGLVLDEVAASYLAADPATGGDPRTLNLASLTDSDCAAACDWRRVVRGTLSGAVTWTATAEGFTHLTLVVSPPIFTLDGATATRELDVAVRVDGGPLDAWVFGELVLTADDPDVPEARLPVAVIPTAAAPFFADGFESGDTTAWSSSVP